MAALANACAAPLLCPAPVLAQRPTSGVIRDNPVVRGTLTDALSGEAVEGAMVVLLDPEGDVAGRAMTEPDGTYRMESRRGGRFTVRADRIGHESTFSDLFELHAGDVITLDLVADVRVIELAAIDVDADPRCVLRPQEGRAVAAVWAEARKSLEATEWSARHGLYSYEFFKFDRYWNRSRTRLERQTLKRHIEVGQAMFVSAPIESLMRDGFVIQDADGRIYRGPDAGVLLSDPFLDTHCFRVGPSTARQIALEFQPVDEVELTDIEGVMWLDRATGELNSVMYQYKNTHDRWAEERFGGLIEFDRLPTGPAIIRRWSIRMPYAHRALLQSRPRLIGIREEGAEVLVVRADTQVIKSYPSGSISGRVTRGPDQRPAAGVVVAVDGVDAWAESDSTGAFDIGPVIGGPYTLVVYDEASTRVGRQLPAIPLEVGTEGATIRNIHLEDPASVLADYCGRRSDFPLTTVVTGRTRTQGGGALLDDVEVRAEWTDPSGRSRDRDADSNRDGFYHLCSIPRGIEVTLVAERDGHQSPPTRVTIPLRATHVAVDFVVPVPPPTRD